MKSSRCRIVASSHAMFYLAIAIVFVVVIDTGQCVCPSDSTATDITISMTESCELSSVLDLSGLTLTVEGELVVGFVEELVVGTLIVTTSGRISANGKGFSGMEGPGRGTPEGSGGKSGNIYPHPTVASI